MPEKTKRACERQHPEPAATAWRCPDCARALTGLPAVLKRPGLCEHLGEVTRSVDCDSCTGRVSLKVYSCGIRGEATLAHRLGRTVAVCDDCLHWSPAPPSTPAESPGGPGRSADDSFRFVSPLGTGLNVPGVGRVKPWEHKVTAILPHLNTPEYLRVVIDLLRLQTVPPYIVVVDTGSPYDVCEQLESWRSVDLEFHFIRGNGYSHTSEPVAVALDVGFSRVGTPFAFLTHTDCFPMKREALAWMLAGCGPERPVKGWQMSSRAWLTDEWRGMVSHTFTMLHAETIRRIGATWNLQRARDQMGKDAGYRADGWPDTETGFAYCLRAAGVTPELLGEEVNYERQTTEWWDHARSLTGTRIYAAGSAQGDKTDCYAAAALEEAKERVLKWRRAGSELR